MKVLVIGGTGLIGRAVIKRLLLDGHSPIVVTRNVRRSQTKVPSGAEVFEWDAHSVETIVPALEGSEGVVNLAGENIGVRWTPQVKERLVRSRVGTTRALTEAMRKATKKPSVLLQASAVGYYGYEQPAVSELDETAPAGSDFLANLCREWEAESADLNLLGIRRIVARIGVVLSPEGGALARMILPFKLGVGGPIGTGKQPLSWVSLDDVAGAIVFLLTHPVAEGVFNITSPNPVTSAEFACALGRALHRPAFFPIPGFVLKAAFGEMAEALLLNGQRVLPRRLQDLGYSFRHPDLASALPEILRSAD